MDKIEVQIKVFFFWYSNVLKIEPRFYVLYLWLLKSQLKCTQISFYVIHKICLNIASILKHSENM